ncbi:MAG TPA: superoxide dismutase family protein [Kofleriaceae bacterium]
MIKVSLFAVILSLAACGGKKPPPPPPPAPVQEVKKEEPPPPPPPPPPAPKHATAQMAGTKKFPKVKGTVEFKETDDGVEVTANLEGLKKGDHGFHIHEKGDCSAPDATSAGGHFNPSGHKHGAPDAEEHHEGDLGNITAEKDGKATKTFTIKGVSLKDGDTSIVGKGFIIHAKADDMKTQPTGNAGDRVACGVITLDEGGAAAAPASE